MSEFKNTQGVLSTPQGARIVMLLATLALVLLGVVMVYSAGSLEALRDDASPEEYLIKPLVFAAVGIAAGVFAWKVLPYSVWRGPFMWIIWGASMFLLFLTAVMGTVGLGAQRWLVLGPVNLQPSEFAKIALIMMTAHQFALLREGRATGKDFIGRMFVLVFIPLIVFLYEAQSDLGTTIIVAVGILAVMWLGEVPRAYIFGFLGALFFFGFFAIVGTGYRSDRFAYLDPWNDGENGLGNGYQIIRSYYSLADGGIFGVGLGNSRGKYDYLPEAETDFIYAVVCEELGMIGGIVVIGLFIAMLMAGMAIASQSVDSYGSMLAGSLTVMLVFQAFLNIGCVVGLLPTTGKPLPFLSSGGSSLMASLIMVGLILAVSEGSGAQDVYERRRANLRVVRSAPHDGSDGAGGATRARASRGRYISGSGRR